MILEWRRLLFCLHLLENRVNRADVDTLREKLSSQERTIAKLRKDLDVITSTVNKGGSKKKKNNKNQQGDGTDSD
jgi:hypothetical protein